MKFSLKNLLRMLALFLVFAAVVSLAGNPTAAALENEPYLYMYSGGDGTYTVGDVIKVVYKYSPCNKYEYTYCELYNSDGDKLATSSHSWENSSTDFVTWTVKIDTGKLELKPDVYTLKSYVYYKKNYQYTYITASVSYSKFTLKTGASIELNREKYTYTVSYLKTTVPKKTITLKATVDGSDSPVTWTSSDKTVATVSSKGKVTMKALGTCKITATVDGVSASCKITVKKQTGTTYYNKYIKPVYQEVLDCVDEPFEDLEAMRENCDAALEAAQELKTEINKVKALKKDSLVKKYMNVLLTNVRKADQLAWMDGVDIDNAQMIQYRKTMLEYVKKLNSRVKKLVK